MRRAGNAQNLPYVLTRVSAGKSWRVGSSAGPGFRAAASGGKIRRLPADLDNLRVVLVSPRNPLNIGAAARAMSNFGCLHLRLVNPYKVAFREARSAVGAGELLKAAQEYKSLSEAIADCSLVVGTTAVRHRELQHQIKRLEAGGRLVRAKLASRRVALLFGPEKTGLSNEDLSHCHWLIRIATRAEHISMNLGQAVAVCLYELARDGKIKPEQIKINPAASAAVDRISSSLFDALKISGYVNPRIAESSELKVRRMIRRLNLSEDDAEMLLGMLRQILWKLRSQ
jgi:TrmH family RNA methyltransferase